jgi:hypothetical protein
MLCSTGCFFFASKPGGVDEPHLHRILQCALDPHLLDLAEVQAREDPVVEALDAVRLLARRVCGQACRV